MSSKKAIPVIHYHVRILSRSKGHSAIRKIAYITRSKVYDQRTDQYYDYSKRDDLVHREIILPSNAPNEFVDSSFFWNSVEAIEKNKNAVIARDVEFALPKELNRSTHIKMVQSYVKESFVDLGMCAEFCIHDKGDGNPHVHLMLTTRSLDEAGNWMFKSKKVYKLDEYGNKIFDEKTKRYKCKKTITINDWNNRDNVELWRERWADECNKRFAEQEIDKELTHRSYARQGLDIIPTIHIGNARHRDVSDRIKHNEWVKKTNREREERELERKRNREKSYSYSR